MGSFNLKFVNNEKRKHEFLVSVLELRYLERIEDMFEKSGFQ